MAGGLKVAVVGSGVAGLSAAWVLASAGHRVVLYERDSHVGGHAWTQRVDGHAVDVGFMVFNR
jgi:phytoene dehydrogenase-like protein